MPLKKLNILVVGATGYVGLDLIYFPTHMNSSWVYIKKLQKIIFGFLSTQHYTNIFLIAPLYSFPLDIIF